MNRQYVCALALALALASCGGRAQDTARPEGDSVAVGAETAQGGAVQEFPYPAIPDVLRKPEERKDYLLRHFWDNFDFSDSTLVDNRDVTEQGFVNQIALLVDDTTPDELRQASIDNLCNGMERQAHARSKFLTLMEDYLYSPNSPLYNEALYALCLRRMAGSTYLDEARRSTLRFRLKLVERNMPGRVAEDFDYYRPDGGRGSLHSTPVAGDRLLLLFYDPECSNCHETLLRMASDKALAKAVRGGRLTVLAVYTEGNEQAFRQSLPDLPEGWIVATDREEVKAQALYDLKAMPSLYLLDGNKTVVLKDATYDRIASELGL